MKKRGQTSLEYLMLIAAAALVVVIVILVVRNNVLAPTANQVATNATQIQGIINNLSN
jgi:uncharacterized protein (UPF0333 family)